MVGHPDVNKIAFTGSTDVGRIIAKQIAAPIKRQLWSLAQGANIVFEDAALDQAVEGIVNGIFFNQGHVCCAGSRLLVQESVHDVVYQKAQARAWRTFAWVTPMDKNTDIGAINSKEQLTKIDRLVKQGVKEGGQAWAPSCAIPKNGFWYAPTIITGVSPANTVVREEIFGPVLSVMTFRTPAEAVAKANNSQYGLSAGCLD